MKKGTIAVLLAILYTLFATPWYLPKTLYPQILGLPLWVFITVLVILILGYIVYFVSAYLGKGGKK